METFKDFDLLETPLEGTSLIEASAGTGKSFSIAGLFLRLVVEKHIRVHEILVVTFTRAATEELKERIRKRLRDALRAFESGDCEEEFLRGLLRKEKNREDAVFSLKEAIRNFDQAAIMTIHGFCWRILRENAFESLNLFDMELVSSQELIKEEIVEDYWRKVLYSESPLFVHFALQEGFRPSALISLLGHWFSQPRLHVIPEIGPLDASAVEHAFVTSLEALRSAWPSARGEIADLLMNTASLKKNCYPSAKISGWLASMECFLSCPGPAFALFPEFEKFATTELGRGARKGCSPPSHTIFDLCESVRCRHEEMLGLYRRKILGLKSELFRFVGAELSGRKRRRNIFYFDDLLSGLFSALQGKAGRVLTKAIHEKYKAALIDEFQDTDPLQYAIFREIFVHRNAILFLIGDPKQSIYGFRGADIFAYMEASKEVETRFTLRENWRSAPNMITALNVLFKNHPRPFVYESIRFHPCRPAPTKDSQMLLIEGKPQTPFRVWLMDSDPKAFEKSISRAEARESISMAVAREIQRLLGLAKEGRAFLGARPVREEDIAVLVRRNREAVRLQQILSKLHIPSVLYSTGNLFDSHEAMELERVLTSIASPENGKLLRAALATDILGLKAGDLERVNRDEKTWEEWVIRFKRYQELWIHRGFAGMFRQLIRQEKVLRFLMGFPDGERRCTNLLHLSEVLHHITMQKRLNRTGLLRWFSMQRSGVGVEPEEHPIRLESDEKAVKLVTVHKSKGLEYQIVFCPFAWDGSVIRSSRAPFAFHSGETSAGLTLDLGSERVQENRKLAEKELLSENLRMLYVSLTRAKSVCYFVWGRFKEAESSAPAYLLYPHGSQKQEDVVDSTRENFLQLGDSFLQTIKDLEEKAGGAMVVERVSLEGLETQSIPRRETGVLCCRKFGGRIEREWRVTSFSSLIGVHRETIDVMDRDDEESSSGLPNIFEERRGFFSFPAGVRAGSFLHDLFEHLDFTSTDPGLTKKTVRQMLMEHGYEPSWEDAILEMIEKVLHVPLDPDLPGLSLCTVKGEERLNELEFHFPLKRITPKKLDEILRKHALHANIPPSFAGSLEDLEFSPVRGYMKGFIDLVFRHRDRYYLVDWKSNDLGPTADYYGPNELAAAMRKGYYILQLLIYTVAIDRYLSMRLPGYRYDEHFGGACYLFVRGMDQDRGPESGIFRARPPEALIRELSSELIRESKQ